MKTGIYRHYKNKLYEVIGIAINSNTDEKLVLYKALYDNPEWIKQYSEVPYFVKPEENFLENVEVDGVQKPRFEYVGEKYIIGNGKNH